MRMSPNSGLLFLSTPSARRATLRLLLAGFAALEFLSTPSARRATCPQVQRQVDAVISIHALREEGDRQLPRRRHQHHPISIHALREEGDLTSTKSVIWEKNFYPRPPRGGRLKLLELDHDNFQFLSTPSARRATVHGLEKALSQKISIHALREEGDGMPLGVEPSQQISIHALREEGDPCGRTRTSGSC